MLLQDPVSYFGGSTVHGGKVRKLQATTFREVVERYINVPVPFRMTRREFLAHPDRDKLKDGPYLVPCSYPWDEGHRCDADAEHTVMVILDLDEGPFVTDFAESPETLADALRPYNFAAWTTAKHTSENPRIKVMVDVEPCDPKHYRRLVAHVCTLLGIPAGFKGSRESNVISQPAYRPMQFRGEEYVAVLGSRTNGYPLTVAETGELDAPEADKRVYAADKDGNITGLAYLPVAGLSVADVREPLFKIDPDCTYKEWVEIAAALRHQFTDEDDAREAYQMFDEWSGAGSKYKGEKETYGKWKSFKPYAVGRNPVTIRTLFRHAMNSGWDNVKMATRVKEGVSDWIKGQEDVAVLLEEGARRIAEMPFRNEVVEEALVVELRSRIKLLGGGLIDKATIKKEVRNQRTRARVDENDGELEPWLRPICFIAPANVFRNTVNGVEYSPAAFDNTFSVQLMNKDDAEAMRSGRPTILPVLHALNVREIKRVDGVTYDPRHKGEEPYFKWEGREYLNEYRIATVPQEDPENSAMAGKWFRKLLDVLVGDPGYCDTLLDYFAFVVQHPGEKIRWAPLIQSCQGAGKGTLGDMIAAALGEVNVAIISPGAMASDFNSWRYGSQFCILDELKSPGHARHETSNKLKDAITNDRISLNQKFKDPRVIQNVTNFIAFTNFKDSLYVEDSDRRYYVIESPLQCKEQLQPYLESQFFSKLHHIAQNFPGAIRHFLANHPISPDFPVNGPAPETRFKAGIIDAGKNVLQVAIENLIEDERHPLIGDDIISIAELNNMTGAESRNNARPVHFLRSMGWERYMDGRKYMIDGVRTSLWVHPMRYFPEIGCAADIIRMRATVAASQDLTL